jgi:hypothetical protein
MKPEAAVPDQRLDVGGRLAGGLAAVGVLVLGLFPGWMLDAIARLVR